MALSARIYRQLAQLLPDPRLQLARVVSRSVEDDTSVVELAAGQTAVTYSGGLATGSTFTVRGSSVPAGGYVFIRAGAIDSVAPPPGSVEIVVGRVTDV